MSICIYKAYYQFIKILKTLFKHFGLDETQYSNSPILHYSITPANFADRVFYFFEQPQKTAILSDCNGVGHAQI